MPEAVETKEVHFLDRLIGRPVVVRHAVGGNENAGAIIAEAAMDKNFFVPVVEERKELRYLIVRRRRPAADGNTNKANAA